MRTRPAVGPGRVWHRTPPVDGAVVVPAVVTGSDSGFGTHQGLTLGRGWNRGARGR